LVVIIAIPCFFLMILGVCYLAQRLAGRNDEVIVGEEDSKIENDIVIRNVHMVELLHLDRDD